MLAAVPTSEVVVVVEVGAAGPRPSEPSDRALAAEVAAVGPRPSEPSDRDLAAEAAAVGPPAQGDPFELASCGRHEPSTETPPQKLRPS